MRSRKNNNALNIKDYIVPIFIFVLIFILIYVAFSWNSDDTIDKTEVSTDVVKSENSIQIDFWSDLSEVEVIKSNNKKEIIKTWDFLNPWESIIVKSGDISFEIPEISEFSLDVNWKVEYLQNSKLKLESSSLWIKSKNISDLNMRYAKINIGKDSVVNLEQTEVSSTIYLLKWKVEVINNWGKSTFLTPWTKIIISSKNASSEDLDMNLMKEDFDDYFPLSPWFLKNNGSTYLNWNSSWTTETTGTWTEDKNNEVKSNLNISGLLNFDNIYDEWSVISPSTNISWKFVDGRISKITIDWKTAVINVENKSFNVLSVNTSNKSNDIIIKIFDEEENILSKYVYTLYYSTGLSWENKVEWFAKINSEPYPVNGSDFIISIPTVKDWKSTSDENTFYWTVKNPDVKSVTVNGYKLKTFNGKTFRYHAYKRFWTLWDWVNNYEVIYYDINWKVILKKYVSINKEVEKIIKKQISWEAQIN